MLIKSNQSLPKRPSFSSLANAAMLTKPSLTRKLDLLYNTPSQFDQDYRFVRTAYNIERAIVGRQSKPKVQQLQVTYYEGSVLNTQKFKITQRTTQTWRHRSARSQRTNSHKKVIYPKKAQPLKIIDCNPYKDYLKGLPFKDSKIIVALWVSDLFIEKRLFYCHVHFPREQQSVQSDLKTKKLVIQQLHQILKHQRNLYLFGLDSRPIAFLSELQAFQYAIIISQSPKLNFALSRHKHLLRDQIERLQNQVKTFNKSIRTSKKVDVKRLADQLLAGATIKIPQISQEFNRKKTISLLSDRLPEKSQRPKPLQFDQQQRKYIAEFEKAGEQDHMEFPVSELSILQLLDQQIKV